MTSRARRAACRVPRAETPVVAPRVVAISDGKTGQGIADILSTAYTGPVRGIDHQFIDITPQSLSTAALTPGLFIHTGSGNDAVALLSGTNVVDGGTGSNFLTAGTGADTFFVDARNAAKDVWTTVSRFHHGDSVTFWGISPASRTFNWFDDAGAAGYTGLTLQAKSAGSPNALLTLPGFSRADLASGRLSAVFGHDTPSESNFLYVITA